MTEDFIRLNAYEIAIIISSLQLLSTSEEKQISEELGSVSALYNKLYTVLEQINRSETGTVPDLAPSY